MAEGWIKLHRKVLESDMCKSLSSKQFDVMTKCLLLANHKSNVWEFEGRIFECQPGQFITSIASLTRICSKDVKVQSVKTALLKLEKWGFLTNKSTNTGRLITICKWGDYQGEENQTNQVANQLLTNDQPTTNQRLTTNKNVKNVKNDKNDKEVNISFSVFWDSYDKKTGDRNLIEKKWNSLSESDREAIISYIPKYKGSKPEKQYRLNPSTFLNGKRWNDEIVSSNIDPNDNPFDDPTYDASALIFDNPY